MYAQIEPFIEPNVVRILSLSIRVAEEVDFDERLRGLNNLEFVENSR